MINWLTKAFNFVWDWYYKTHSNPVDGELSNRSQLFTLVVFTGCFCLVREAAKHDITRDWVEGFTVLMLGVGGAKVWKRGEKGGYSVGETKDTTG